MKQSQTKLELETRSTHGVDPLIIFTDGFGIQFTHWFMVGFVHYFVDRGVDLANHSISFSSSAKQTCPFLSHC